VAAQEPFFGVVGFDDFRMSRLDDAARARFYESGEQDIARVLQYFDADFGARPRGGRALDLGCGVGRLTRVMAGIADEVVGYDVAPSMIAIARQVTPANVTLTTEFPKGPFDWINSYIVFQHIPPKEGLALLDACLAAVGPSAFLSLQITGWRDGKLPSRTLPSMAARWFERWRHRQPGVSAEPLIRMYDYDFGEILKRLTAHGFGRVVTHHTQHGGHHGAWFIARRTS
jgi:SAM-dependent methyltransferase